MSTVYLKKFADAYVWKRLFYERHVLDHPIRNNLTPAREKVVLTNPYI
jgi:hypothetical protein